MANAKRAKRDYERDAPTPPQGEGTQATPEKVANGRDSSQSLGFGFGENGENPFLGLPVALKKNPELLAQLQPEKGA